MSTDSSENAIPSQCALYTEICQPSRLDLADMRVSIVVSRCVASSMRRLGTKPSWSFDIMYPITSFILSMSIASICKGKKTFYY